MTFHLMLVDIILAGFGLLSGHNPASMDKWVPYGQNQGIMPKLDPCGSHIGILAHVGPT